MTQNLNPEYDTSRQAEETLRLVAQLRPPAQLADRIHRRLAYEAQAPARRSFWSLWMPARRLQFAAAAVLVLAVVGSTWSVYHVHPKAVGSVQTAPVTPGVSPGRALPDAGSFGSAGAERVPPTLNPIKVPPAPKKKPSGSRGLAKPSPKTLAVQPATGEVSPNSAPNQ